MVWPRRKTAWYSLSHSNRYSAMRVPRPTRIGSTPVAAGSSVPAWPTFGPLKSPRTLATISWEVQPAGLWMLRIPSPTSMLRFSVTMTVVISMLKKKMVYSSEAGSSVPAWPTFGTYTDPHFRDHIVRGPAGRLVDVHNAVTDGNTVGHRCLRCHRHSSSLTGLRRLPRIRQASIPSAVPRRDDRGWTGAGRRAGR